MAASGAKTLPAIGFFTVTQNAEWGYTGGLLILNVAGRPLEFHCTAPIKPNRAQEILYGPTLQPFLYGEQIGRAVLEKAKSEMLFVCTNVWPAMSVRQETELPVVFIKERHDSAGETSRRSDESRTARIDSARPNPSSTNFRLKEFALGPHAVAVLADFEEDQRLVLDRMQAGHELDLSEPFGRICDAIQEAQRGASP